jgi:hypothetical protein
LWKPLIEMSHKQNCSACQKIYNNMWHATCTHVIQGDSWLLMVASQIDILTPSLSFSHDLCYKYSNGSCEPILDIYVLRYFPWYKQVFNPMNFKPWNYSLKIWDSIRIPTPNARIHLGVCGLIPSHFFTFLGVWM